jgi:hypothetical protein
LRAWRALIGLPMLVVFGLDAIYQWTNGPLILSLTALVTLGVLVIVGAYTGGLLTPAGNDGTSKIAPQM